ncbi:MAG: TonB dep Rec protein, partial [Bacteroidetes bacterium]|nr:TonB dep Rec protein [Bacteroidota bacterium]
MKNTFGSTMTDVRMPKKTLHKLSGSSFYAAMVLTILCLAGTMNAKTMPGTTGILEGRVRDKQTKEILVGVNVVLVGTSYGTATDTAGLYRVGNLRAGLYDVRYSLIGYKSVVMKSVTILPDLRTRVDLELEASAVEMDVVEIRAERPLIQKDLAATVFHFGQVKLEKLPISSFREVLLLQPSTTLEGNLRGGKTNEVVFLVDGLPVQDVIGGGLGALLPRSSITELTIQSGGFNPEYGNALSGIVNVITRSGGNDHKFALRIDRDSWLPASINKQQDRLSEVELTASGPLVQDRLMYFTANSLILSDMRWWQDLERFFPSPISTELTGFTKLDYLASPQTRMSLQAIYDVHRWRDYEFSWRFNLGGLPVRNRQSFRSSLLFSHTLSASGFITASLSVFHLRSKIGEGPGGVDLRPYEYDFFLQYVAGGQRNWWADTRQTIYSFKADYTVQANQSHLVKAGVEINQYDLSSDILKNEPQITYFGKPILDAPLLSYSDTYRFGPRSGSVYIQDKVEVERDGSNLNFGLRWDFLDPTAERPIVEFVPVAGNEFQQVLKGKTRAKFKHQLSPRLSLAAPVGPFSILFVNFGHYFQFPLFEYLYSGITPAQLRQGTRNVLTGNPDLEAEQTVAWEIGFKHVVTERVLAAITYFKKRSLNQIDSKTLIPFDSKYAGDYGFGSYVNNAEANVSGIEVLLSREQDERFSGSISYSYMVTEGLSETADQSLNYSQWGFPIPSVPYPLSWDQRHTLKVDTDFRLPFEIQGDIVMLYNSARPYTLFPTRDGFTPLNPAKLFIPNNARMRNVMIINAKFSRQFNLDSEKRHRLFVYIDARNVVNRQNVRWMDSSGRIGGELGDPSAYYDPRRVRVGVKWE